MKASIKTAASLVSVFGIGMAVGLSGLPAASPQSSGPPPPEYVHFSGHSHGALYRPDPVEHPDPTTAFLVVHRVNNYMNHVATQELPDRGFIVLGMNTHAVNNEAAVNWERMPRDLRAGVEFLYDEVGVDNVVLYGHSGGGPNVTLYQAIAEKGLSVCQGPNKVVECPDDDELIGPPADAIVLVDTHPGNTINRLRRWNPAVRSETNPERLNADLNPFLERNGYNPDGCSLYTEEFKNRYFVAQAERSNRLIDEALSIKADQEAGRHFPTDNDDFIRYRNSALLMGLDNTIDARTVSPRKLLKDNREIVTDIVETVRPCNPAIREGDALYNAEELSPGGDGARDVTVNSFLGDHAIRATNSMYDIDWCSSNNSTTCMVQHIDETPLLVTASQGHYFMRDNEINYEMAATTNKDFVVIEGATHSMGNCGNCDGAPYLNVRENFFDYLAEWVNTGFEPVDEMP
jgi:pimeloyl-ACP methyl ester carboxylesterase